MNTIDNERFSIFSYGWFNTQKQKAVMRKEHQQTQTISWVYEYIKSERAKWATEEFRKIPATATKFEKNNFKVLHFESATFSGIFPLRSAAGLKSRTPFLSLDFDHLQSIKEARKFQQMFIHDPYVETALSFVSPSGQGVKWIVELPEWTEGLAFREQFEKMRNYICFNYGIDPDISGSDVCRTCFLPWDDECYINPKYVSK